MIPPGRESADLPGKEAAKAASKLEIEVRKVVEGLQGGKHASVHLGASVEFADHKRYSPGDDLRHIDWRAFARTDRHFVKTHEREVTLRCLMILDCSRSMAYRGSRALHSKISYGKIFLGALAHVLVRQGDAVGLLPFDRLPRGHLVPDRHPEFLSAILDRLAETEVQDTAGTGFVEVAKRAAEIAGHRAMIVIVSDLWGADQSAEVALGGLCARGHDVALIHLLSPDEVDFPFDGTRSFEGMEGEGTVVVDPALVREDYRRAVEARQERWRGIAGRTGLDLLHVETGTSPVSALSSFASRRRRWRAVR